MQMHELSQKSKSNGINVPVYLIFRVFNLGKQSMGCVIYVDPGVLETQGALKFTSERWSVTPARR
jgi:hypothetical protein